jgi:putative oxidoreductase
MEQNPKQLDFDCTIYTQSLSKMLAVAEYVIKFVTLNCRAKGFQSQHSSESYMLNGIIPSSWSGHIHAALRIMTGLLFMQHGMTKLLHWPATDYFPAGQPLGAFMTVAGTLELVGGLLIVIGLFTRITGFVLAGMMAVAYFLAHASQAFIPIQNGGELAIMFCFVFLYLASVGAGPFSIDDGRSKA